MAAVSMSPSPHIVGPMASRRVPLSHVPNAANSPFRAIAVAASKRSRGEVNITEDVPYDQPPPPKKQLVEIDRQNPPRTPPPRKQVQAAEGRVFNKKPYDSQLTAFDQKLLAVKNRTESDKVNKNARAREEPLENLRQWQRHYRKMFPNFAFYFESIPEETRRYLSKRLRGFGATEAKFFSREVSHVITTRSAPSVSDATTSPEDHEPATTNLQEQRQLRTINPSLLERSGDMSNGVHGSIPKNKFTFESNNSKGSRFVDPQDVEPRRNHSASVDILQKAKDMGMKIWHVEKFSKILSVMSEDVEGDTVSQHGHNTRGNTMNATKTGGLPDLNELIEFEELKGHADREITAGELVTFKGPYIYVRDMNEKTKPIMVREYPKVQHREEGAWSQFRSAPLGKCPFIEEVLHVRRDVEKDAPNEGNKDLSQAHRPIPAPPNPRPTTTTESERMQPPAQMNRKRPLSEIEQGSNIAISRLQKLPSAVSRETSSKIYGDSCTLQKGLGHIGFHGGEPMASGMQASNMTSAIRSQMISSTAAAPGAKAGTSKDIYGLQRKVLERNTGPPPARTNATQSTGLLNVRTHPSRSVAPARMAKQKAQERLGHNKLTHINEETTPSEQEEAEDKAALRQKNALKALKGERKEPKPGYCENCRDKFEDFEEHTLSRKHRRFATTKENWNELDTLLTELIRPFKRHEKS